MFNCLKEHYGGLQVLEVSHNKIGVKGAECIATYF